MKFKAHIKLTDEQYQDLVRHSMEPVVPEEKRYFDIEFTLQDLAYFLTTGSSMSYSFKEILIPWLLRGNMPEIKGKCTIVCGVEYTKEQKEQEDYLKNNEWEADADV